MTIHNEEINQLADSLFEIGAVKFGAFRLKLHESQPEAPLSPIYLNFRLLRSYPQVLGFTAKLLLKAAEGLSFELLADIPTGVTPVVAVMAYLGNYPMITPRQSSKSYGLGVAIDGDYQPGQRVLLVDDVVSGGDSKLEAAEKLEKAGLVVKDLLVIVDREQGGAQIVQEKGYNIHFVATISQLLARYRQTGAIDEARYLEVISYLGLKG